MSNKRKDQNIPPDLAGARSAPPPRKLTNAPPPPKILSGGGASQPSGSDFAYWAGRAGKPDWPQWLNMAIVDFDDACYLSLDIDPAGARKLSGGDERFPGVKSRYKIAENHLGHGLPAYATDSDSYYGSGPSGVKLSEFRAWGESLPTPFTFPDEFPRAPVLEQPASQPKKANAQEDAPLNTRERNNLLRIIRALDAMNPKPLPEKGYAESVRAKIHDLGLTSPSDDTIRKVIEDARSLDS